MQFDPRLTPARPDLAAKTLEGKVQAARFVDGITREVIDPQAPVRRHSSPDAPLDTEALIWLKRGEPKKALELMDGVVRRAPSGSAFFHLAQVELSLLDGKLRDKDIELRAAWKEARDRNLKKGDLHPLEWPAFSAMTDRLK